MGHPPKTLESLDLWVESDETSAVLNFTDKTVLNLDFEPGLTVRTEYSNWKTENGRKIKRWPPLHSPSIWLKE